MTQSDQDYLSDLFAGFVEDMLDGRTPAVDRAIAEREHLRNRIEEIHELAHRVAGRNPPARPHFEGYDVLHELGRGGMGTVFLARQRDLGRNVALKVLPPSLGLSTSSTRRFLDEARTLARLSDDRIVKIHQVIDNGNSIAYAMEWIDGQSFRSIVDKLRRTNRLPTMADVEEALEAKAGAISAASYLQYVVRIGISMARALGVVHREGIVHRDVKPSNILIRRNGDPLLVDFGISHETGSTLTVAGTFIGTPRYASPEQLRNSDSDHLDGRSDIYSLATTLFEAIALRPRISARTPADVLKLIDGQLSERLRALAPHAPKDLEVILQCAMDPDPAARYATAEAFADDLERLLLLQPIHARPPSPGKRLFQFARRQRKTLGATALGAILVIAAWLPISNHLQELSDRPHRIRQHVRQARSRLLSSAGERWHALIRDRNYSSQTTPAALAGEARIHEALEQYSHALAIDRDNEDLALEYAIVAFASRLSRVPPKELHQELDAWPAHPSLTTSFARAMARGVPRPSIRIDRQTLEATTSRDRRSLGLLAFLVGNVLVCERSWGSIDPINANYPLVNAALALLHEADSNPTAAYPRLSRAVREFPEIPQLMLGLANVAVDLGEAQLAQTWLQKAKASASLKNATRFALITGELAWLQNDTASARKTFEQILNEHPDEAEASYRLARMDQADGNLEASRLRLEDLVAHRPHTAKYRRRLAELAILTRDARLFLAQARYVVAETLSHQHSDHSIAQILDILRIGGLQRAYRRGLEVYGRRQSLDQSAGLMGSWPDLIRGSSTEVVETMLEQIGIYDALKPLFPIRPSIPSLSKNLESGLAIACRLWLSHPQVRTSLSPAFRISANVLVTRLTWNWVYETRRMERCLDELRGIGRGPNKQWQKVTSLRQPQKLSDHICVANSTGAILFGGNDARRSPTSDTWKWNGSTWEQLSSKQKPAPRLRHAAALDPVNDRIVMFGGSRTRQGGLFDDTWLFENSQWRQIDTKRKPSARNDHAMAWDPTHQRILLFGGHDGNGTCDDTWIFDGQDWSKLSTAQSPPARRDHTLTLDSHRNRLVLFGGITSTSTYPDMIWEWDGLSWSRVDSSSNGPLRVGSAAAYDPQLQRTVIFSGIKSGRLNPDLWTWDGVRWRQEDIFQPPAGRSGHTLVFDPRQQRVLLFGGYCTDFLNDTWLWSKPSR